MAGITDGKAWKAQQSTITYAVALWRNMGMEWLVNLADADAGRLLLESHVSGGCAKRNG
jgi:hypothetical protein